MTILYHAEGCRASRFCEGKGAGDTSFAAGELSRAMGSPCPAALGGLRRGEVSATRGRGGAVFFRVLAKNVKDFTILERTISVSGAPRRGTRQATHDSRTTPPSRMKTMRPILTAAAALAVFAGHDAQAETMFPGDPNHPDYGYRPPKSIGRPVHYTSVLIQLIWKLDGSEAARKAVRDRITEHPEEVNDYWVHDGWSGTPLTEAIQRKDVEVVTLLLEKGAIPFAPGGAHQFHENIDGNPEFAEVLKPFYEAQKKYPAFHRILYSDPYRKENKK